MKTMITKTKAALIVLVLLASTVLMAQSLRNKVAVMPIGYIADGSEAKMENMRFLLQEFVSNYLNRSAAELKMMDVMEVNAVLAKKGIDESNIRQYTPKELAAILNVEYVITGTVLQDLGTLVTVDNRNNTRRQKIEHYGDHTKVTNRNYRSGSTTTQQNIETQVTLAIYNESGEKIYGKSRHSLLSGPDAYRNTIEYLLKRTPLYKR